eukprot:Sspe_Gene.22976::Locus_8847_Transcript_1_1_Confidence_1.000_Length_2606::g.22976::m.22976
MGRWTCAFRLALPVLLAVLLEYPVAQATFEVPAVVRVPDNAPVVLPPDERPTPVPPPPEYEGPPGTVGLINSSASVWEREIRSGGLTFTLGVAPGSEFTDVASLSLKNGRLVTPSGKVFVRLTSNLVPLIFEHSYAAELEKSSEYPLTLTANNEGCNRRCRVVFSLRRVVDYHLPIADEILDFYFGDGVLEGESLHSPKHLRVTVLDDDQRDNMQMQLADGLEILVGTTLLFGASGPAALEASRMFLLLHMKCGVHHNALDHATNPTEVPIGSGANRYYIGGLASNCILAFIPILVHFVLVLVQWQCKGLLRENDAPQRPSAGEAGQLARLVSPATASRDDLRCCGGITITEFRQLQATVRYPHYTLLFPLFAFQGVATCGWKLLIQGETSQEQAMGLGALLGFNILGSIFAWWKLGRGMRGRIEAEYVFVDGQSNLMTYFLGPGEWVSSTKRRLVHTYGILFEFCSVGNQRFLLVHLSFLFLFALMGTLDAEDWGSCIGEFCVVIVLLAAMQAVLLLRKPYASTFDLHFNSVICMTQLLSMLLFTVSFGTKDINSPAHQFAEVVLLVATGIVILRVVFDIIFLAYDTVKGRRWRLQEAFEQGHTLFRGLKEYRQQNNINDDGEEAKEMLRKLAPQSFAVFTEQTYPRKRRKGMLGGAVGAMGAVGLGQGDDSSTESDEERTAPDTFSHTASCPVTQGLTDLTARGRALRACPHCSAKPSLPDSPLWNSSTKTFPSSSAPFTFSTTNGARSPANPNTSALPPIPVHPLPRASWKGARTTPSRPLVVPGSVSTSSTLPDDFAGRLTP